MWSILHCIAPDGAPTASDVVHVTYLYDLVTGLINSYVGKQTVEVIDGDGNETCVKVDMLRADAPTPPELDYARNELVLWTKAMVDSVGLCSVELGDAEVKFDFSDWPPMVIRILESHRLRNNLGFA